MKTISESEFNILNTVNTGNAEGKYFSQRSLAQQTNLSLGQVNRILANLKDKRMVNISRFESKNTYTLTTLGVNALQSHTSSLHRVKASTLQNASAPKTAVILAAGKPSKSQIPSCLFQIDDDVTPLDRTLALLRKRNFTQIIVVVGFKSKQIVDHVNDPSITFIENRDYMNTGTMKSLSLIASAINDDFIIIEGDTLYDSAMLDVLLEAAPADALLTASLSGSGDEAFVDFDSRANLVQISKDIRQMNRLSAEMIGICRLSFSFFKQMLTLYADNQNQWLNYEYLITQVASTNAFRCLSTDNLSWIDLDSSSDLINAQETVWPAIKRHEKLQALAEAKEKVASALQINVTDITKMTYAGGMTNTNYSTIINGTEYFVRIPGKGTEKMINRTTEKPNALAASQLKINVPTRYMNAETGIKITETVPGAVTLSAKTLKFEDNLIKIADILHQVHTSDMHFKNHFSFVDEWHKYEQAVSDLNASFYPGYQEVRKNVFAANKLLIDHLGIFDAPCHNDLVPENFIKDEAGKIYLIDWEYSGLNDPSWDLGALCNESNFSKEQINYFLAQYYGRKPQKNELTKVKIYMAFQDVLWSTWTIVKEASGVDFGNYGITRFNRAKKTLSEVLNLA